ncbi:MAG: hypothetical protein ACOCYG_04230 [Spirochaetota bacterium]
MAVFLEDSNGKHRNDPSDAEIAATLEQIGVSLDHCVLHLAGEAFVQSAGDASGLLVQYGDGSGVYESDRSDLDVATVTRIFVEAAAGRDGWKSEHTFHRLSGGPETGQASPDSGRMQGSLKDQLLGRVKREIGREASQGVGRVIRRGIRGIMGRR